MAAIANMTLVNAAAGNVTYVPIQADGNAAEWSDTSGGSVLGYKKVSIKKTLPKDLTKGNMRVRTANVYPVLDTDGNVLRVLASYTDYVIPASATLAEKQELYAREKSLQALTVVKDSVETQILPL